MPEDEVPPVEEKPYRTVEPRASHRKVLASLRQVLRSRYGGAASFEDIAKKAGTSLWIAHRILTGVITSPKYVDMTQLIVGSGMTPNEAAQMCGLYAPSGAGGTPAHDRVESTIDPRVREAMRVLGTLPQEVRESTIRHIVAIVEAERLTMLVSTQPKKMRTRRHLTAVQ